MKFPERVQLVETLPYESRLGFIAFCVERCLDEARRHPAARQQLEQLPLLAEGLDMLWARAEDGIEPDQDRIRVILEHLAGYEKPAATSQDVDYSFDVTLVEGARVLTKGMRALADDEAANARYVTGALEGPAMITGLIYAAGMGARKAELAVIDTALLRLHEWGTRSFSRLVFEGIEDWPRGELTARYAKGQLTGTKDEDYAT
jgi:hypothetical protein